MEYNKLGNSGIQVSRLGLGTNNFGWRNDEESAIAVVNQALELGINFIDTADIYGRGKSEEFIGQAIKGRRSQVIVATKFGYKIGKGPNDKGASRAYIIRSVEASLRRLQTDYIDLYQIHVPDPLTPVAETMRTLDDLVRSGKVRYIGCSNFAAWQLCEALWVSRSEHLNPLISVQPRYNLLDRQIESELVPCCQAYDIGIIPWGPLIGGFLTGKYRQGEPAPADSRLSQPLPLYDKIMTDENWQKLAKLEAFATQREHTVGELAIAWLLAKPCVSTVIAGARKPEQLTANVTALEWELSAAEVSEVDDISAGD